MLGELGTEEAAEEPLCWMTQGPCPDSARTAVPRSGSWRVPLANWRRPEPAGKWTSATNSAGHWGKRTGEGFVPCGAAGEPRRAGSIPCWGLRDAPRATKLVKTKPACAPVSLARSTPQEVKRDTKDLAEQQQISKAALDQLVTQTAEEEQEQVRCGGSSHHPLAL